MESSGYTLVICEKPDAAMRVADALSGTTPASFSVGGVVAYRLMDAAGKKYVVCAALGHLYGVSDTVKEREVYPVFDLEWFPIGDIDEKAPRQAASRIRAIERLSKDAAGFVNACDLDIEGETIGYNILRYACDGKQGSALRAKFSTLTREEILEAFRESNLVSGNNLAMAGRLRHAIDFVWGINVSRALSESLRSQSYYRTVSIGRVQGPTLNFVVEREIDIRTFVPTPYWNLIGTFRKGDVTFEADHSSAAVVATKRAAEKVKASSEGRDGVVSKVTRSVFKQRPPPPFNLADLQKEAYGRFGYTPSQTLRLAERLYLDALISYPRTGSQKLPRVDYRSLLSKISRIPGYGVLAMRLLSGDALRPSEGDKTDSAHPAIYPTGQSARRHLGADERRVFDLVVRRFLSCFGEDSTREAVSATILVGEEEEEFTVTGTRVVSPGWLEFQVAGGQPKYGEKPFPPIKKGDSLKTEAVGIEEKFRLRPPRFNQGSLLEKMEREGIGTKATRGETISTLLHRGYVAGESLAPTELGFSLVETMRGHCPQIISTGMTREIERQLELIESSGGDGSDFFEEVLSTLLEQVEELKSNEPEIAGKLRGSIVESAIAQTILGRCPMCKEGKLRVIRSYKTGKRFVGCTNYSKGCTASAPLPQRGSLKPTSKPCAYCGWPVAYVRAGRRPWKLCINLRCPRKVNIYAMQNLQKDSKK
ncbi:MAG: DNA topoisomerase I [Thaumarchaeota archaeon]|nr:DNA topoisomerase I [Nitrososphaerota archaeon]